MRRYIFFILTIGLFFSSCSESGFSIKGSFDNAENINVYFDKVDANSGTNEVITKTESDASGNFNFKFEEPPAPGIYRVRMGIQQAMLVLDENPSPITLKGDLTKVKTFDYTVEGSATSAEFQKAMGDFAGKNINSDQFIKNIKDGTSPVVSYLLANIALKAPQYAEVHRAVYDKIKDTDYAFAAPYENVVKQMETQWAQQQAMNRIRVGELAPDIEMEDPDGNVRKLSDLKGQLVLLDFWASWCGPCRKANPKVVETYKKYNDKGFTVFSVSLDGLDEKTKRRYSSDQIDQQLDNSKQRWLAAIQKDQLTWDHHVSDLRKWDSMGAAKYGVRSIPKTFLIDREGKIAAVDPRYNLEEMVKKFI